MENNNIVIVKDANGTPEYINGKSLRQWYTDKGSEGIETLTEKEAALLANITNGSSETIKEHNIYFANVGGYFERVALVYKNGRHIYYASDSEIHHKNIIWNEDGTHVYKKYSNEELHKIYVDKFNSILFTDSELMGTIRNYDEYTRKSHFLRNYWIMQYDYKTAFYIASTPAAEEEHKKTLIGYDFFNPVSFAYVKDKNIIEKQKALLDNVECEYQKIINNIDLFRQAIRYELNNHETCITYEYNDALGALGLRWSDLTSEQKTVVKNELNKCIYDYANSDC